MVKCEFLSWTGNPFVSSCWSDVRNCGKTMIFVCRGRLPTPCAHFIHFCARRCSDTYILIVWTARRCSETHILILPDEPSRIGFGGSIARNCGETQILSSWNCSAHWPGRVNVCVLYLQDGSAHCICYRNLLSTVVPENLPRG